MTANQYGQHSWQDSHKIFDPISNRTIQVEFIQTMIAEHPLFANYYDPANITIDGGTAKFIGGQMSEGSPRRWKRGFSRADWPHSENFEQSLYLVEYGLFGDMTSHDFGKLAFKAPELLAQVFDAKIEGIIQQWKRAIENHILYNILDKHKYAEGAWEELPKHFFKISTSVDDTKNNQLKALSFIAKVESKAYKFLDYSEKYNHAGKEAVSVSLKSLTLILDPSANTFLNIYGYSGAYNVGYLELRQKFGKVIVKRLGNYHEGDVMYQDNHWNSTKNEWEKRPKLAIAGRHTFNWKALLHDTNFYKIHEAINHPGNDDVFINSEDYNIDLTSYVGKWWFCFEGVIRFVNACAWVETEDTHEEIKARKPAKEEKKAHKAKKKEEHKTKKDDLAKEKDKLLAHDRELNSSERNKVREAHNKHELEAIEKHYHERVHGDRAKHLIAQVEKHWKSKAEPKTLAGKLHGKSITDVLGVDWKHADKFNGITHKAQFKTKLDELIKKIDDTKA